MLSRSGSCIFFSFFRYAFQAPLNYYRALSIDPNPAERIDNVPVCSIFGAADTALSVSMNKDNRLFVKDFEDHYLEGVSHWSMMEAPERVNAIMEKYLKSKNL